MVEFYEDASDVFRELDRLENLPGVRSAGLDAVLEGMFQQTQADVHQTTGHLKRTGRSSSRVLGDTWTGTITYGAPGDADWTRDPRASYALFELERGGTHDYMRATRDRVRDEQFQDAIADMLQGGGA